MIPGERTKASISDLVADLAAAGRYHFTTEEATKALGTAPVATRAALRRIVRRKIVATPQRGFHVILPPEYRRLGCLPPEQFVPQLMASGGLAYYVGLLSAAQYHGAAHQRPQQFQVMVGRNRPPISCGEVRIAFIARKLVERVPVIRLNTPRGSVRVATPEATALDLVGYPSHAGGLDGAATVLADLAERIDPAKLTAAARVAPLSWAQRLGYLLELVGAGERTEALAAYVGERAREYVPLATGAGRGRDRSARWRVVVNAAVEAEA